MIAPEASATAELVFDLATALGWEIPTEAARALYVGILTDTGGFRFSNTTPRVLRVASALLERGVDPESIYGNGLRQLARGEGASHGGSAPDPGRRAEIGLAWVTVPPDALARHSTTADDLDGIVEYPRQIAGVRLALLFRQLANGRIKVSFRSMGKVDAAEIAQGFGGGGHRKAAGASAEGSLADVQQQVLDAARRYLRGLPAVRGMALRNGRSWRSPCRACQDCCSASRSRWPPPRSRRPSWSRAPAATGRIQGSVLLSPALSVRKPRIRMYGDYGPVPTLRSPAASEFANVVIYLDSAPTPDDAVGAPHRFVMQQQGEAFVPHVLARAARIHRRVSQRGSRLPQRVLALQRAIVRPGPLSQGHLQVGAV